MKIMTGLIIKVLLIIGLFGSGALYAQSPDIKPLPGLLDDLKLLADKTNAERLEALTTILSEKEIAYEIEPFTAESRRGTVNGRNLVVTFGSGSKDFVLGAHYDKVTVGSGVVDNGASSIILTRVAEALKNETFNNRLRIVWFDVEERGLIGSAQFIETHKDDPIVSMINLDVNGYGDTMMFGPTASTGMHRLYELAQSVAMKNDIGFILFPRYGGGDDISFQRAGIENISIGVGPLGEVREFWLAYNGLDAYKPAGTPVIFTNMHSENDAMDKIQPLAMTYTYTVILEMIKQLDKMIK